MSTPEDRLDLIQDIYSDALNNEPHDLAQSTTAVLVSAVQANVANARATYYAAAAAALTSAAPAVETAYVNAQSALGEVQKARSAAAEIATLLGKLNSATSASASLLSVAKDV
jgi:hypothetical protein